MSREIAPRLKAAVAASAELQERDALKSVSLAVAMTNALVARGVPDPTAALAGELGVLAFERGYAQWSESERDGKDERAEYTLAALNCAQRAPRWADRHPDLSRVVASAADWLNCRGSRSSGLRVRPVQAVDALADAYGQR